jgi:hypothetical protein
MLRRREFPKQFFSCLINVEIGEKIDAKVQYAVLVPHLVSFFIITLCKILIQTNFSQYHCFCIKIQSKMLANHPITHHFYSNLQIWAKSFVLLSIWALVPTLLHAQTDEQTSGELLENFFRDNESATESDAQLYLEMLDQYKSHPINLNKVTKEGLMDLRFLNELQVDQFIAYRDQFGPFLNALELQAIPDWDVSDIRRLMAFSKVESGLDNRNVNILNGFYKGDNEVLIRYGYPTPFTFADRSEGPGNAWAIRVKHSFDNRLRFGFTAESDPGEAIFKGSNKHGFDFYSAHLFFQNVNRVVKTVAIGDYSARFGQGLLLQTGFAAGKSAETVSIARGGRKLNAYGAFGETYFFRGVATTLSLGKHVEITALFSSRLRDGNVQLPDTLNQEDLEIRFTSLQSSGLHRTTSEIEDEKSLKENVGGVSGSYIWKSGQVSVNGLYIGYDKPWSPSELAYRRYAFRGKSLTAFSVDYNWRYRNWLAFGETARSDNGGVATVNGLLLSPDRHVTLSAVHRSLAPDYQSIYGNPFAEVSGSSNEKGLYMGADIRWIRRVQINVYADVWRHPWLRFGVGAPSQGHEYLARVFWTKSKTFSAYVLFQTETKESDTNIEGQTGLIENQRNRIRLHATYKVSPGLELRSRIEWTTVKPGSLARTQGFIAYQEAVCKPPGSPVSGSFRYAIYDTDNYDTRVYAYENDLFSAVSIPAFSGRGTRYYFNLTWRVNTWLRLETRFEQTLQTRSVTSSGVVGDRTFLKFQARMNF